MPKRASINDPPKDKLEPYLDTPRSIAAHRNGVTVRLQKNVDGLSETSTYSVTAVLGSGTKAKISRTSNMPVAAAIERFMALYRLHIRPELAP